MSDEPGAIDDGLRFMDSMDAIGFRDLWRHRYPDGREFSRSHRGNGLHRSCVPVVEPAARAGVVRYSHEERLAGLSDHSMLLLIWQCHVGTPSRTLPRERERLPSPAKRGGAGRGRPGASNTPHEIRPATATPAATPIPHARSN
jgi:hypothetical protein